MRKSAWLIGAAVAASIMNSHAQESRALDRVLSLLDSYLVSYEKDLSVVIADENFLQEVESAPVLQGPRAIGAPPRSRRQLTSEVAFFWLNGEMDWLGFRRVLRVDGKPVKKPGIPLKKLLELIGAGATEARWAIEEASKHNLGTARTINTPSLPLYLLHRRHRERFHVSVDADVDRVNGRPTAVWHFDEFQSPSLVRFGDVGDLESHVRAWVDSENGSLWRAEVRLKPQVKVNTPPLVRVEFRRNKTLGILVPVELYEEFIAAGKGNGRAVYSNFRRFETSGKMAPQ